MKITLNTSALLSSQTLKEQLHVVGTSRTTPNIHSPKQKSPTDVAARGLVGNPVEQEPDIIQKQRIANEKDIEAKKLYFNL